MAGTTAAEEGGLIRNTFDYENPWMRRNSVLEFVPYLVPETCIRALAEKSAGDYIL